jgi:DNA-binding NtrC family response regulator
MESVSSVRLGSVTRPSPDSTATDRDTPADSVTDGGLLLVAGEGMLTTFPLAKDETVIGRGSDCDISLSHATLSRRHVMLRLGPPLSVQDLDSHNGTRVARTVHKGGEPVTLAVGESFHIGRLSFVVVRTPRTHSLSTMRSAAEALRIQSPTVEHATSLVRDIAKSGVNALILGETGVGKEVLADTLHRLSERKGAFVRVNCAALAPNLFESELFGHEKGAFTGAAASRVGLLEAAQGGTVFLDEVGELPAAAQAKLLRAIESKEIVRVGGVKPVQLDVRFLSATNRDLAAEAARGEFRSDLFFRLDGVTLVVPPLRERREQISTLAMKFLRDACEKQGARTAPRLSHDLLARLEAHKWPGNVRELKAVLERALLLARGGEISPKHLSLAEVKSAKAAAEVHAPAADAPVDGLTPAQSEERQRIVEALESCAGNQTRAAKVLGMSRSTLAVKLALYKIPRPRR